MKFEDINLESVQICLNLSYLSICKEKIYFTKINNVNKIAMDSSMSELLKETKSLCGLQRVNNEYAMDVANICVSFIH